MYFILVIQCPDTSTPAYGYASAIGGSYKDEITFTCHEGYEFSPDGPDSITIRCNATGDWTEPVPTCQSML